MKEVFLPAGNGHAGSAGSVGPRRHWRSAAAGPTSPKRGGNSTLRGAVSGDVFDEPPPPKAEGLFLAVDPLAAFVAFLRFDRERVPLLPGRKAVGVFLTDHR